MAAPIITCPACTKKFKGKEGITGKRIKCPLCATPFVVSETIAEQAKADAETAAADGPGFQLKSEEPTAQPMKKERVTWDKEDDNSNPYALGQFEDFPRCPNCANRLEHAKAVICLFCGYNTQTREWGQTVKAMSVTGAQHFAHLLPGIFFLIMLMLFIYGILFFALSLPPLVVGTWASFFDHESMRMWIIGLLLGFMWAFGILAFRRLVLNPKPKEREKQ
jgi:hypothetical protein